MWRRIAIFLLMIFSFGLTTDSWTPVYSISNAQKPAESQTATFSADITKQSILSSAVPSRPTNMPIQCDDEGCRDHMCHFGHCSTIIYPPVLLSFEEKVNAHLICQTVSPQSIYLPGLVEPPISQLS